MSKQKQSSCPERTDATEPLPVEQRVSALEEQQRMILGCLQRIQGSIAEVLVQERGRVRSEAAPEAVLSAKQLSGPVVRLFLRIDEHNCVHIPSQIASILPQWLQEEDPPKCVAMIGSQGEIRVLPRSELSWLDDIMKRLEEDPPDADETDSSVMHLARFAASIEEVLFRKDAVSLQMELPTLMQGLGQLPARGENLLLVSSGTILELWSAGNLMRFHCKFLKRIADEDELSSMLCDLEERREEREERAAEEDEEE